MEQLITTKSDNRKIAVICHLFYLQMYIEIRDYLKNFENIEFDLFVTLPEENSSFFRIIQNDFPNVRFIITENIGFDIYPFLCAIQEINLDFYDLIFKIHSKKDIPIKYYLNGYDFSGPMWRKGLLSSILASNEKITEIINLFHENPELGSVGGKEFLTQGVELEKDIDMYRVEMYMKECGLSLNKLEFFAGSMFVIRPEILAPIKNRNFLADEFPSYFPRDWNGLPYCLERMFGMIVSSQGYYIQTLRTPVRFKRKWF